MNPPTFVLLIVLIVVSGWVVRGLASSWFKLEKDSASPSKMDDIEERLKKVESATTGILLEVQSIREKERFMARLQAGASTRDAPKRAEQVDEGDSPFMTQSIPVMPRARLPRQGESFE